MAQVHYWELSNYNSGNLIGKWFDVDGVSYEEHLTELGAWLAELTASTGELCEEYIIGDVEDIPSEYVGTWSIAPDFFKMSVFIAESHLDEDVIKTGVSLGIPLESIEDAYYGQYESDEALADEYIDNGSFGDIPDYLQPYIDTKALGRDLAFDFLEDNGFYFHANW